MKSSDINPLELFAEGNPKVRQKRELYFWIQKAVKIMLPSDGYKKRWAFDISILQCLGMKDCKASQ